MRRGWEGPSYRNRTLLAPPWPLKTIFVNALQAADYALSDHVGGMGRRLGGQKLAAAFNALGAPEAGRHPWPGAGARHGATGARSADTRLGEAAPLTIPGPA